MFFLPDSNFRSTDDPRRCNENMKLTATIVDQSSDEIRDKIQSLEIAKENILRCDNECAKQPNLLLKKSEAGSNVGNTKILSTTRSDLTHLDSVEKKKREEMMIYSERSPRHYGESPGDEKDENVETTMGSKNKRGNVSNDRYGERPESVGADSVGMVQTENRSSLMPLVEEDKIPTHRRRRTLPSSTNESSSIGRNKRYESAQSMSDHEIDDSSHRETPPKMRRIDNGNYSSGFQLKCAQERAPKCDEQTPGQHQDSSPLGRSYLPSCVSSSDNLSNIPDWPKISRGKSFYPAVFTISGRIECGLWPKWALVRLIWQASSYSDRTNLPQSNEKTTVAIFFSQISAFSHKIQLFLLPPCFSKNGKKKKTTTTTMGLKEFSQKSEQERISHHFATGTIGLRLANYP